MRPMVWIGITLFGRKSDVEKMQMTFKIEFLENKEINDNFDLSL